MIGQIAGQKRKTGPPTTWGYIRMKPAFINDLLIQLMSTGLFHKYFL